MTNQVSLITLAILAVAASACGSGNDTSTVTMAVKSGATSDSTAALRYGPTADDFISRAVGDYGDAAVGASGVSSFKLYISSIQLCADLTTNGTAYSNTSGCTTIYSNEADNYNTFALAEAAAAGSDKYIDLISSTDRAKLTKSASITAGTYNYGLINWYKPVKMTATVARTAGNLCTKAYTGGTLNSSNNLIFAAGGLACGTAAETIALLNNGGTWFKFLAPFTAVKDTAYAVDLAFNLDGQVKGGSSMSNVAIQDANGVGINVPMLKVVPVPRSAADTTKVESIVMTTPSSEWKLRVDLYYTSSDTSKTILAADINVLTTSSTNSNLVAGIYAPTAISISGTTVTFKDYLGATALVFDRSGTSGTLTCPSGATLPSCTAGSTVAVTYSSSTTTTRTLN